MEEALTFAALAALATKLLSSLKYLIAGDVRAFVTQALAWLAGFAVIALGAQADLSAALAVPGTDSTLGALDFWSQVLVGLSLGSSGSFAYDLKRAFDNTDSAKEPPLAAPGG